jgi:hypothetical protein
VSERFNPALPQPLAQRIPVVVFVSDDARGFLTRLSGAMPSP